jgi:uncharacterized protein YceK
VDTAVMLQAKAMKAVVAAEAATVAVLEAKLATLTALDLAVQVVVDTAELPI